MKKFLFACLLSILLIACMCECEKSTVYMQDGTTRVAYGLETKDAYITFYNSKEESDKKEGMITVPLSAVKQIVNEKEVENGN